MKIETSNIEQFRNFFDVIYDEASESVELQFYMDKVTCAVLNKAHTRFFYAEYESKFFDIYGVDEVKSIMVSVVDLYKVMKLANKTDTMTMEFKEDLMVIQLINGNNKRIFEFPYPYDEVNTPRFPQVAMPVTLNMDLSDISQTIKDINLIGNNKFKFVISQNTVTLMSDSADTSFNSSAIQYASVIETDVDCDDVLSVMFPVSAIRQMADFDKISKEIEIEIGEQALLYKLEDEFMGATVRGMIAPLVEEE